MARNLIGSDMVTSEDRLMTGLASIRPVANEIKSTRMEVGRLVVLVPDRDTYGIELARRVWALAEPCELKVLLLCVPGQGASQEPTILLRLITLASQVRSERVQVDTCIEHGMSWSAAVSRHWHSGDLVICCAEQTVHTRGHGMQPLWQVLEYALGAPVFVLTGLYARHAAETTPRFGTYARWIVPLIMISILVLTETHMDSLATGFLHTLALIGIGLAEMCLLALWSLLV